MFWGGWVFRILQNYMLNSRMKKNISLESFKRFKGYGLEYRKRFYGKLVCRKKRPKRLLGQNGIWFLLRSLQRSKYLYSGLMACFRREERTLAFFAARAHFETTGAVVFFYNSLKKFYANDIEHKAMNKILERLTVGGKVFPDKEKYPDSPEPFNVLKLIDEADKLFSSMAKKKHNIFREEYEFLSEFCHPNCLGLTLGDSIVKPGTIIFHKKLNFEKKDTTLINGMNMSCTLFFPIYDKCFSIIREREEIPGLFK